MTEPQSHDREEIFAFGIEPPGESLSEIPLAGDQDPSALTEAGVVAARVAALVERSYVGERMAANVLYLKWGEFWHDTHDAYLRHDGAADFLVFLRRALPAPYPPRAAERLDRIAARVLLGRARARLAADPDDAEATAVADAMRGELGRTA